MRTKDLDGHKESSIGGGPVKIALGSISAVAYSGRTVLPGRWGLGRTDGGRFVHDLKLEPAACEV